MTGEPLTDPKLYEIPKRTLRHPEGATSVIPAGTRKVLARIAIELADLEYKEQRERRLRDAIVLRLVSEGCTWREVADAAGIANPYIAALKKRAKAKAKDHASVGAGADTRKETTQ